MWIPFMSVKKACKDDTFENEMALELKEIRCFSALEQDPNKTNHWNTSFYSSLSFSFLTSFLLISSLLLHLFLPSSTPSNLLSLLTDTYTCNSQPDPSESKLRFELPATGQISERNPEWRRIFAFLRYVPRFPSCSFVCLFKSELFFPHRYLTASHQKVPGVFICSESRVVMFLILD